MERIPENKMSVYSNYTQELKDGSIDYLVGYSWTDEIIWSDAALPYDISPAFSRVDMKASLDQQRRRFRSYVLYQ